MTSLKSTKSSKMDGVKHTSKSQPRRAGKKKIEAVRDSDLEDKAAQSAPITRKKSKQQNCLDLLRRAKGASVEELQEVTGWQAHTVRGFLSGHVKRKLGLKFVSQKAEDQPRRYHLPSTRV